jgi:uncharacterized radical SAM protein YgiQ
MRKARRLPGIKHVFTGSGIRMDLALLEPEYIREIALHHTSGYLKVAPEHAADRVLEIMKKPRKEVFERFITLFSRFSREAHKEQYITPYVISAHPGSRPEDELELALFLKERGFRPRQIQDFLPSPMDISTAIYYTGRHPMTGEEVHVPRGEGEKKLHRALIQYFKKESVPLILKGLKNTALGKMRSEVMSLLGKRGLAPAGRKPMGRKPPGARRKSA